MSSRSRVALWISSSLALASACFAAVPELEPGTCTYLVGAPPGGVAAPSEERFDGTFAQDVCFAIPTMGTRAFGTNSVQINLANNGIGGPHSCLAQAWVGHEFSVGGTGGPFRARIDVSGFIQGVVDPPNNGSFALARVEAVVAERDPLLAVDQVVGRTTMFERDAITARYEIAQGFEHAIEVTVLPGRTYSVKVLFTTRIHSGFSDFGPPGNEPGVRYDAIEVCIDAPAAAGAPGIDDIAMQDLEERLYLRECYPGIWMPEANGGKLETARQLVVDRIAQATASGDPNVNTRVAQFRILMADSNINGHQYQRACKNISDALRALTTP